MPKEYRVDGMPLEIEKMWQQGIEWLKAAGAEIVDYVSLPHTKYALPVYYDRPAGRWPLNLARYDGVRYGQRVTSGKDLKDMYQKTRAEGFGEEVRRRILVGTYVLSAGYYALPITSRRSASAVSIYNDFMSAFEKCDVLLTPTAPSAAFPIGENEDDPVKMYLNDVFTVTGNLAGLPGLARPPGWMRRACRWGCNFLAVRGVRKRCSMSRA